MIRALFVDQWDAAVTIASILAFWAILTTVYCFATSALIAAGHERMMFFSGLIVFVFRFAGVVLAAPYGLELIAWSIVLSGVIELIVNTWFIKEATDLSVRNLVIAFIPNALITLGCWLVAIMVDYAMPFRETNPWLSIAVLAVTVTPTWLVLLKLTRHEAWNIVFGMLARVFPRLRTAS